MMAKNHVLFAGLAWVGGTELLVRYATEWVQPFTAQQWGLGLGVCMSAGLASDIDHPDASAANAFGPAGKLASHGVNLISGGHRKLTHTVFAVIGAAAIGWFFMRNPHLTFWYAVFVAAMLYLAGYVLDRTYGLPGGSVVWGLGAAAAGFFVASRYVTPDVWLPIALGGGVFAHIVGDSVTLAKTQPFYPLSDMKVGVGVLRTGSGLESLLTPLFAIGLIVAIIWRVRLPFG